MTKVSRAGEKGLWYHKKDGPHERDVGAEG